MTKFNRNFKILIVDDEKVICDFLSRFLRREGHSADIATNGTQALEMIQHKNYDLIFCDVKMPNMNGEEMIGVISKCSPIPKVFVISGLPMLAEYLEEKKFSKFVAGSLNKPFSPECLLEKLR